MKFNRFQAFCGHLLGSIAVAAVSAGLLFLVWYPGRLAGASGVTEIYLMLLAIDVVVGPCITFIVFNPKKKGLERDLLVVLLLQIGALLYGLHAVFIARPVYEVFNVDRFDLVFANDLTDDKLNKVADPQFKGIPLLGPKIIAARRPDTSKERIDIAMNAMAGGDDIAQLPQYYVPYLNAKDNVVKRLQPIDKLREFNKNKLDQIDALNRKYAGRQGGVGFLPMRGKVQDLTVIVARDSAEMLETLALNPW